MGPRPVTVRNLCVLSCCVLTRHKELQATNAYRYVAAMVSLHRVVRWVKLNHGVGKEMRSHGAEILSCPHCDRDTPVFRTEYSSTGTPISFSVCLWCDGVIEYGPGAARPHEPYATARDIQADRRQSKL